MKSHFLALAFFSGSLAITGAANDEDLSHPSLLVTARPIPGLRSVDAVRRDIVAGRSKNYNYQQSGHNVLSIGDDEYDVDWRVRRQGRTTWTSFDDNPGAAWSFDLSEVYAMDRKVRRHVIHLLPRIVVILDEAELPQPDRIRLRWHTSQAAEPDAEGRFTTGQRGVNLAGCVTSLSGEVDITAGRHEYLPPYDKGRLGNPYPQRHEPFVEVQARSDRLRLLSLFCVTGPHEESASWKPDANRWTIETPEGTVIAEPTATHLVVKRPEGRVEMRVPLP